MQRTLMKRFAQFDEAQHARIDAMLDGMGAAPAGENEGKT